MDKKKGAKWKVEKLKPMNSGYKTSLKEGIIQIINNNMVLYKPILANDIFVSLIIVPTDLRWKISSHFHAGPSGDHMGE